MSEDRTNYTIETAEATALLRGPETYRDLIAEMSFAEAKAWDALARYKFWMFGYWAAIWVHLNRISKAKQPNPWVELVKLARSR